MAQVTVIIPVYNQWELTRQCLVGLHRFSLPGIFHAVVVDNGSTDETRSECPDLGASLFGDDFRYYRFEQNLNFGPACNFGAFEARTPFVLFLNNDTIPYPGWLPPLLETMSDEAVGAASPVLLYPDYTVQHLGVVFSLGIEAHHYLRTLHGDHPLTYLNRRFQAISGAAMLVDRERFLGMGGFHEGFVNGCEDLDFCARLRREGLECAVSGGSRMVHYESCTEGRGDHDDQNARLLALRCPDDFEPDYYEHAAKDGLEVRITDEGILYAALSKARSAELFAMTRRNIPAMLDTVMREPFWEEGYGAGVTYCVKQGMHEEALEMLMLQSRSFPHASLAVELRSAAIRSRRPDIREAAERFLRDVKARYGLAEARRRVFEDHIEHFTRRGETEQARRLAERLEAGDGELQMASRVASFR